MSHTDDQPKRRRWLPRWSMRAMFVMITIVCVVFGLVVWPAERQRRAVESLRLHHGDPVIRYDYEHIGQGVLEDHLPPPSGVAAPGPTWLRDLLGIDYLADVVYVDLSEYRRKVEQVPDMEIGDDDLRPLRHLRKLESLRIVAYPGPSPAGFEHFGSLPRLRNVRVYSSNLTDDHLAKLSDLTELRELIFFGGKITDEGLAHLKKMTKLQTLSVHFGPITDRGLRHLAAFEQMESLSLKSTTISGDGLRYLHNMTQLRKLDLSYCALMDDGLVHLAKFDKLTHLVLLSTRISDEDLRHLAGLSSLRELDIRETKVTKNGVATLQSALPNCKIDRWGPDGEPSDWEENPEGAAYWFGPHGRQ